MKWSGAPVIRNRNGFTLVELMFVIGIIVFLMAITLPVIIGARKSARRTRIGADLQSISLGLEAFKTDTGDYPRVTQADSGAAVLCYSLMGPFNIVPPTTPTFVAGTTYKPGEIVVVAGTQYVCIATATTTPPGANWIAYTVTDLADGPGIRLRAGGKVYGPYLSLDRFKVRGLAIVDVDDSPVLYYPSAPVRPNITLIVATIGGYADDSSANAAANQSLWDTADNKTTISTNNFRAMTGDVDLDGRINGMETAVNVPFILWSAGPDATFGPTATTSSAVSKCDDVTNFR